MILCIENSKDTSKNLNQFINEFSKVAGYKINVQKSVPFLYTNSKLSEIEIKKTISLTITSKRIKYLRINLTKEVKDPYLKLSMKQKDCLLNERRYLQMIQLIRD